MDDKLTAGNARSKHVGERDGFSNNERAARERARRRLERHRAGAIGLVAASGFWVLAAGTAVPPNSTLVPLGGLLAGGIWYVVTKVRMRRTPRAR